MLGFCISCKSGTLEAHCQQRALRSRGPSLSLKPYFNPNFQNLNPEPGPFLLRRHEKSRARGLNGMAGVLEEGFGVCLSRGSWGKTLGFRVYGLTLNPKPLNEVLK